MNYIITAILAFLTGFLLWLVKRDKYLLYFYLIESDIFPSNNKKGKYYILKIKNKGNKVIENINIKLDFKTGNISKPTISDPELINDESINICDYSCKITSLNPKEIIQITITKESENNFDNPIINIRAKGVNGQKEVETDYSFILNSIIYPIVIAILIGYFGTTLVTKYFFNDTSNLQILDQLKDVKTSIKKDSLSNKVNRLQRRYDSLLRLEEQGLPDRQEIIFSILNKSGLTNLIPEILKNNDDITYKNSAFLLFNHYLIDKNNKTKYLKALKDLSETKDMYNGSKGIVFYLIYKLYKLENDTSNAAIAIDSCKKVAPLMEKHLMENDKYFKIDLLKSGLKN